MKIKVIISVDLEGDFKSGTEAWYAADKAIEVGLDYVWEHGKISGYTNKVIETKPVSGERMRETMH
jgi:hypothetical protein